MGFPSTQKGADISRFEEKEGIFNGNILNQQSFAENNTIGSRSSIVLVQQIEMKTIL